MIENFIDVSVDVLASRGDYEDGQLKIVLEAILSIDDMIQKEGNENKRILVVGSSSEDGVASGIAYEALPIMLKSSEVDLYDKNNNEGEVVVNSVRMKYYDKNKYITEKDSSYYDLLLDDAWESPMYRSWDRSNFSFRFPHFSVKWFEDDPCLPKSPVGVQKYYQVFKTGAAEIRLTSRMSKDYSYRNIPLLGNCPGCRELKFRLRGSYDDSLYKWFMKCHYVNCIDHSIKRIAIKPILETKKDNFQTWYRISKDKSDFSFHKVMYYNNFDERYKIIPVNQIFEKERLIFSDFSYVTIEYYRKCYIVVLIGREAYINVKDLMGYVYDGQNITVQKSCIVRGLRERGFRALNVKKNNWQKET